MDSVSEFWAEHLLTNDFVFNLNWKITFLKQYITLTSGVINVQQPKYSVIQISL